MYSRGAPQKFGGYNPRDDAGAVARTKKKQATKQNPPIQVVRPAASCRAWRSQCAAGSGFTPDSRWSGRCTIGHVQAV
jgi:hypothetical protein